MKNKIHISEEVLLTAAVDAKRVFELTQRVEDLERQVVALSRAPLALQEQVVQLKLDLRLARTGAKKYLTEAEVLKKANDRYSDGKRACDVMNRMGINAHKRAHGRSEDGK